MAESSKYEQALAAQAQWHQQMQDLIDQWQDLACRLAQVFTQEGKLVLAGCGSLEYVAQIAAQNFVYQQAWERPVLPALALGGQSALHGALAWAGQAEYYYQRQLQVCLQPGDMVLLLYHSQAAVPLKQAAEYSRQVGAEIALCGTQQDAALGDVNLFLPLPEAPAGRYMEGMLQNLHLLSEMVEEELFGV